MNISDLDYQQILSNKGIILRGSLGQSFNQQGFARNPVTNEIVGESFGSAFAQATGPEAKTMAMGFTMNSFGQNGSVFSQSGTTASSSTGNLPG